MSNEQEKPFIVYWTRTSTIDKHYECDTKARRLSFATEENALKLLNKLKLCEVNDTLYSGCYVSSPVMFSPPK